MTRSRVRRAFDELLRNYPHFDVLSVDWQTETRERPHGGVWVLVDLGQPSEVGEAWARWRFAILKSTGAVYRVGHDGAVEDEPILEVG